MRRKLAVRGACSTHSVDEREHSVGSDHGERGADGDQRHDAGAVLADVRGPHAERRHCTLTRQLLSGSGELMTTSCLTNFHVLRSHTLIKSSQHVMERQMACHGLDGERRGGWRERKTCREKGQPRVWEVHAHYASDSMQLLHDNPSCNSSTLQLCTSGVLSKKRTSRDTITRGHSRMRHNRTRSARSHQMKPYTRWQTVVGLHAGHCRRLQNMQVSQLFVE